MITLGKLYFNARHAIRLPWTFESMLVGASKSALTPFRHATEGFRRFGHGWFSHNTKHPRQ